MIKLRTIHLIHTIMEIMRSTAMKIIMKKNMTMVMMIGIIAAIAVISVTILVMDVVKQIKIIYHTNKTIEIMIMMISSGVIIQ